MPKMYLRPVGDSSRYSDAAEYDAPPFEREGFEWVEGDPPQEAVVHRQKTLLEELTDIFNAQPLEVQVAFYNLVPQVKTALDADRSDIAQLIIQEATVPAELEAVRAALLEKF